MSMRSRVAAAVRAALERRGLALLRIEDQAMCHWLAEESIVIPLPTEPVEDAVARLRPLRLADAPAVSEGASDPDVIHLATWASPFTEERARRWIQKSEAGRRAGQYFVLAVEDTGSGELAGVIGVSRIDNYNLAAEQFLWLVPGVRRRGLGNHATLLLDRWIFENTAISRMMAVTLVENEAARRQLPTIGYVEEGVLRGGVVHYGRRHDAVQFSLLRSDLETGEPTSSGEGSPAHAGRT
jgi:RimJ/RimL family protein N-acetyltransferase